MVSALRRLMQRFVHEWRMTDEHRAALRKLEQQRERIDRLARQRALAQMADVQRR